MGKSVVIPDDACGGTRQPAPGFAPRAAALGALLLVSGPAALVAMTVWLILGPPVIFRQRRSGLNGRAFTILKFRTLSEERDGSGRLLPDDLRQTMITRWIRRFRLDEIPQLGAVMTGDMSFVGPRPLKLETVAGFGRLGAVRGQVRPGLTGWAQVNGNVQLNDAEKLALDIWYVDHRSVALDTRILLKTVVTLLRGERVGDRALAEAKEHLIRRIEQGERVP